MRRAPSYASGISRATSFFDELQQLLAKHRIQVLLRTRLCNLYFAHKAIRELPPTEKTEFGRSFEDYGWTRYVLFQNGSK